MCWVEAHRSITFSSVIELTVNSPMTAPTGLLEYTKTLKGHLHLGFHLRYSIFFLPSKIASAYSA